MGTAWKVLPCLAAFMLAACSPGGPGHTHAPAHDTAHAAMSDTLDRPIQVHPVHHSALVLEWNGLTIAVDPHAGAERFAAYPPPDLVLITDIHGDHLDSTTLLAMKLEHARILAPKAVMDLLPARLQAITDPIANGERTELKGVRVEALPMYNLPERPDAYHPKGRGNGYVLTLGNGTVYISGDTQGIPEMRALRGIDIAFICMNLPYTMTVDEAADAVLAFKPRIVYPYHYRGTEGLSDVARFKQLVNAGDPSIEVRLEDWYR